MISIDVTDKMVKLVRANQNGAKTRILNSIQKELTVDCVSNGYISDVPLLAGEILEMLNSEKIKDKDLVISLNSSSILTKEMVLPRPKKIHKSIALEAMIVANMGISEDNNVSYTITNEFQDEMGNNMIKLMAVACPKRLVDGYVALVTHLGCNIRQIIPACMALNTAVATYAEEKENTIMVAELTKEFVNLSVYQENKILMSRYVQVDPSDYNFAADFLHQAAYENIYRLLQFMNMKRDSGMISSIYICGDVSDFSGLTKMLASFNLPIKLLTKPANVTLITDVAYEKYAIAIGALTRTRRDYDRYNLMESANAKEKKGIGTYPIVLMGIAAGIVLISAGAFVVINMHYDDVHREIVMVQVEISSEEIQKRAAVLSEKIARLEAIDGYADNVELAGQLFDYQPAIISDVLAKLEEPLPAGMSITGSVSLNGYNVSVSYSCGSDSQPAEYVRALNEQGYFDDIYYSGYSGIGGEYTFSLTMLVKGGNGVEHQ